MEFDVEDNWSDVPGINEKKITWKRIQDGNYSYKTTVDNEEWKLRVNRFPDEPCFTLMIQGKEIIHFNDWPPGWQRE